MSPDTSFSLALTIDVDPDANRPVRGRADAAGPHGEATCDACLEGLKALAALLEQLRIPATLFWEARTLWQVKAQCPELLSELRENGALEHGCHGMRHEDFSGERTGVRLDRQQARRILREAGGRFASVFQEQPRAFRAPYCLLSDALLGALQDLHYTYDASLTRRADEAGALIPYPIEGTDLWEVPLCRALDGEGKAISTYLWQLFEGARPVEDYFDMISSVRAQQERGLLQLALHPWHLMIDAGGRPLPKAPQANLRRLLANADRMENVRFTTIRDYLSRAITA